TYVGADSIQIDEQGRVVLHTAGGNVYQQAPTIYQQGADGQRQLVTGSYELRPDGNAGFHIEPYDATRQLALDPTLGYGSYLGGTATDTARAVAVDLQGNMYLAGSTLSPLFPTAQPYQGTIGGSTDAFISKLNARGDTLLYSTFLGGSSDDNA